MSDFLHTFYGRRFKAVEVAMNTSLLPGETLISLDRLVESGRVSVAFEFEDGMIIPITNTQLEEVRIVRFSSDTAIYRRLGELGLDLSVPKSTKYYYERRYDSSSDIPEYIPPSSFDHFRDSL